MKFKNIMLGKPTNVSADLEQLAIGNIQFYEEEKNANKAKAIFLSTISHELRTPLNGVIGMASLLSGTGLTSEQREYTEIIKSCGYNLMNAIDSVLEYSKIESGGTVLEEHEFNLNYCIQRTLDLFRGNPLNIDVICRIEPDVPLQIKTDPSFLKKILFNLVGNAVKFTKKGEVSISVKLLNSEGSDLQLSFNISDTGVGIPSDDLGKLFKPFSQKDYGFARSYGGMGLGLVMSKKLVELMGGEIKLESEIGVGTTVSFTIKSKAAVKNKLRDLMTNGVNGSEKSVLVMGNNQAGLSALAAQLKEWGIACVTADSGVEALDTLFHRPINLVIADMNMPNMNDIELTKEIKGIYPDLPIVLLSSIENEEYKYIRYLFSDIIAKPVVRVSLYQVVNQYVAHNGEVLNLANYPHVTDFSNEYPMQILIADDYEINQRIVRRILTKVGYNPDVATNGHDVLKAVSKKQYDLIFMDVQMPGMDGLQATKFIRKGITQQPIVIALTANAMPEDKEECLDAGMNDYLSKPFKPDDLLKVLQKWGRIFNESIAI